MMTVERWHELWELLASNEADPSAMRVAGREALVEVDRLRGHLGRISAEVHLASREAKAQ